MQLFRKGCLLPEAFRLTADVKIKDEKEYKI